MGWQTINCQGGIKIAIGFLRLTQSLFGMFGGFILRVKNKICLFFSKQCVVINHKCHDRLMYYPNRIPIYDAHQMTTVAQQKPDAVGRFRFRRVGQTKVQQTCNTLLFYISLISGLWSYRNPNNSERDHLVGRRSIRPATNTSFLWSSSPSFNISIIFTRPEMFATQFCFCQFQHLGPCPPKVCWCVKLTRASALQWVSDKKPKSKWYRPPREL